MVQWLRICRGHRFDPWSAHIPHAVEQLSPCATNSEPKCSSYGSSNSLEPVLHKERKPLQGEARTPPWKAAPALPLEKACTQQPTPSSAKIITIVYKKSLEERNLDIVFILHDKICIIYHIYHILCLTISGHAHNSVLCFFFSFPNKSYYIIHLSKNIWHLMQEI